MIQGDVDDLFKLSKREMKRWLKV